MKKFVKYVFFLLILLGILYGLEFAIELLYQRRATDKVAKLMKHSIDSDIMIFGSSVAYHNFDTKVIASNTRLSTFNMGWDGVFFVQYRGLISEYLSYEKESKCIVMACDYDNLGKNELITRPDLFYAFLSDYNIYECLHDIEPDEMLKARYIPGYKLSLFNKNFYNSILFSTKKDTLNGFDPMDYKWDIKDAKPLHGRFDSTIYCNLGKSINAIRRKGIKVAIVMTPVQADGYKLIENPQEIKDKYKALTGDGIFFFDYSTDSSFVNDKSFFYNYSHLNTAGAAAFSEKFAADLQKKLLNG